jgi:ATPase family AAA domain-containing protein 3A/B
MNKKLLVFVSCFLLYHAGNADNAKQSASMIPDNLNIGGVKVPATDAISFLGNMTDAMGEASQETRNYFERQFAAIDQERKLLGASKDNKQIGQAEYDQACKALDARQARLNEEMQQAQKNGQQLSGNMQNLFMSGWQVMLDNKKEDDLRKTKVAQAAVTQAIANEGALERLKLALQKDNMIKIGTLVTATATSAIGSYYGLKFLYKYLDATLGMPTLVRESSRTGMLRSLFGWTLPTKSLVKQEDAFSQIILSPKKEQEILSLATATAITHAKGLQYRHLLLYGPPGTGKTLIAKTLATTSGMDYAIISGSDFFQFKSGVDIKKMHEIFDWAEKGKRGLILFIDEADALLRKRNGVNERSMKLVDAFLSRTNASSQKFMLILATNYPETLDDAVMSRVNKKIAIPAPELAERIRLLEIYIDKYLRTPIQEKVSSNPTLDQSIDNLYIKEVAEKIKHFSGREIDQLVAEIRIEAMMAENCVVSKDLFDVTVNNKIEQHKTEITWAAPHK